MSSTHSPKLVRLIQCGRRSCSYVLTEDERLWEPKSEIGQVAVCPICGDDSFYTLKANGQKVTFKEREEYRDGVNVDEIEATPRMGPKMRSYLRDAKARALGRIAKEKEAQP